MTMPFTRRRFLVFAGAASAVAGLLRPGARAADAAPAKILLNLAKDGLALQGYDPVAFFTVKAAVKGRPEHTSTYRGARYQFHSAKNKALFDADPRRYEPAFGGYCAFGVSRGRLIEIDVEAFQIVADRLLLQYSPAIRDDFNRDATGNLKKADAQWPALVDRKSR